MPYIINKSVNSEGRQRNFIDVGIHDNVELISVEYKISPNNNPFLVFTFKKDGKILTHTEYEPKDKDGNILESKQNNQMIRLKHIATKFIPEDQFIIEVMDNNFEKFCKQYLSLLGNKYVGIKVRIKVVYSDKNYTSLPRYVPFIERMDVEKSTLEILSIDKMVKDKPDQIDSTPNPWQVDFEENSNPKPIDESFNASVPSVENIVEDENQLPF